MMIRFFLLIVLFFHNNIFAQKKISFDHIIKYDVIGELNLKNHFYLSNSKDESYYCSVLLKNDGSCWLYLNYNDGYIATAVIQIDSFFKEETINFPKQECKKQFEPIKYDVKRYEYTLMSDTLIEANPRAMYGMKYRNKKEIKLYDRGQAFYIVEPGTETYTSLPIFSSYFDVNVSSKIFPKGIAAEMLYYNADNSKLKRKLKLVQYGEIKPKYIVLPN